MPQNQPPEWAQTVQQMQDLYGEWMALLPQLQQAQQQWRRAQDIMDTLGQYYQSDDYLQHAQAWDNHDGDIPLDTGGHYSVLSEDALWDALGDQRALAWQWLRMAVAVLDTENLPSEEDEDAA